MVLQHVVTGEPIVAFVTQEVARLLGIVKEKNVATQRLLCQQQFTAVVALITRLVHFVARNVLQVGLSIVQRSTANMANVIRVLGLHVTRQILFGQLFLTNTTVHLGFSLLANKLVFTAQLGGCKAFLTDSAKKSLVRPVVGVHVQHQVERYIVVFFAETAWKLKRNVHYYLASQQN